MHRRLLPLAAFLLALPAVPAEAATVSAVQRCSFPDSCAHEVVYVAAPGERNVVTLPPQESGQAIIRDSGAPITPGENCTATAPGEVRCPMGGTGGLGSLRIELGDQDDVATASDYSVRLFGGEGVDTLTGSSGGFDTVDGGPGDDRLDGGRGEEDAVYYDDRAQGVTVDLVRGFGGVPGETDSLANFEVVVGTPGDDRITGAAAEEMLYGDAGDDRIASGGGDDQIDPGPGDDRADGGGGNDIVEPSDGNDVLLGGRGGDRMDGGAGNDYVSGGLHRNRIFGGPGNDRLHTANGRREAASCGRGRRDRVTADRIDVIRGCERVTRR